MTLNKVEMVADQLRELANIFALDVCAYAIMSNHTYMVLKINKEKSNNWSKEEVINR